MSKQTLLLSAALLCVSLIGCAKDESQDARANLTERQKDSLIARSPIPGAKAVNKAMITADSATARQMRIDSAQNNP
jgi:hypothetical protein